MHFFSFLFGGRLRFTIVFVVVVVVVIVVAVVIVVIVGVVLFEFIIFPQEPYTETKKQKQLNNRIFRFSDFSVFHFF